MIDFEAKAKKINAVIVLPEANLDKRVYQVAKLLLSKKLSDIIVFGKKEDFDKSFNSPHCQIIDIESYPKKELAKQLYSLRQHKGLTQQKANSLIKNPIYFATMLLYNGLADGMVAGAYFSTSEIVLSALQIIKTKPTAKYVTASMLMIKNGQKPLLFGDVALIENPDANCLAEIAIANANFMDKVLGITPKVAMLSYSTCGSAKSEMVDKVAQATKIAQQKSDYLIDGEMQVDSALNKQIAEHKGATSQVAGDANVLIFPDLNAGNIAYKLVSNLAGYKAIGPIMLNLNKPVMDLSRGSSVEEILECVMLTKFLTQC